MHSLLANILLVLQTLILPILYPQDFVCSIFKILEIYL